MCSGAFHLVLAGSRGAAPAEKLHLTRAVSTCTALRARCARAPRKETRGAELYAARESEWFPRVQGHL